MKNISPKKIYDWPLTLRILVLSLFAAGVFYFCYQLDLSSLGQQYLDSQHQENDIKDQFQAVITKQAQLSDELSQSGQLVSVLLQWQKKLIAYSSIPVLMDEVLQI